MEKVFDEVVYTEELTLKKWTMWPLLSLTKLPTVLVTKRFNQKANYEEPIQVAQEFDPQLKFVTFTVHRDPKYEDVDNNIHPPSPLKSAFEVLMTRQNPCNKVPVCLKLEFYPAVAAILYFRLTFYRVPSKEHFCQMQV